MIYRYIFFYTGERSGSAITGRCEIHRTFPVSSLKDLQGVEESIKIDNMMDWTLVNNYILLP
jgi:hypothetical protein